MANTSHKICPECGLPLWKCEAIAFKRKAEAARAVGNDKDAVEYLKMANEAEAEAST